jgi:hypothetical protein
VGRLGLLLRLLPGWLLRWLLRWLLGQLHAPPVEPRQKQAASRCAERDRWIGGPGCADEEGKVEGKGGKKEEKEEGGRLGWAAGWLACWPAGWLAGRPVGHVAAACCCACWASWCHVAWCHVAGMLRWGRCKQGCCPRHRARHAQLRAPLPSRAAEPACMPALVQPPWTRRRAARREASGRRRRRRRKSTCEPRPLRPALALERRAALHCRSAQLLASCSLWPPPRPLAGPLPCKRPSQPGTPSSSSACALACAVAALTGTGRCPPLALCTPPPPATATPST